MNSNSKPMKSIYLLTINASLMIALFLCYIFFEERDSYY